MLEHADDFGHDCGSATTDILHRFVILPAFFLYKIFKGVSLTISLSKRPDTELAHLAWCILVAIKIARREGKALTALQTHIFIMQWLSNAQKRKVFPKLLAPDILWLLDQGKRYGPAARLFSKVEYIWLASSGELSSQSVLFRFTCMIDTLRTMGWQDYLLSDAEWQSGWKSGASTPAVYTQKNSLHHSFTESGKLVKPLEIRLTGDSDGIYPLLEQCRLTVGQLPVSHGFVTLVLKPDAEK